MSLTATDKSLVLAFLRQHPTAVISTLDTKGLQPEAALIAFAELDTLELIFETFHETRKYENLKKNNRVAVVIGWDARDHITLQYEGKAHPIPEAEIDSYKTIFLKKETPCTETFLMDPRVRLYKITPTWIRYSDFTGAVPKIIEVTL